MLPFGEKPEGGKEESGPETGNPPREESLDQDDAKLPKVEEVRKLNKYEQKLEDKRERLEAAADKAQAKAEASFGRVDKIGGMIPMGQPILVGHHSEARHRRDIARMDGAMRKGVEESKRAEELARRAAKVGTGGISADDPDAIVKLQEKLEKMEELRETMKRTNKQHRKGGWDAVEGVSEKLRKTLDQLTPAELSKKPYASYTLTNLGANIRRVRERIELLTQEREQGTAEVVEGDGYTITEDADDNRVRFTFDTKPGAETRSVLKRNGFRWAPSVSAWQRQLNAAGRIAAERVRVQIEEQGKEKE